MFTRGRRAAGTQQRSAAGQSITSGACGNAFILKPSERDPGVPLMLALAAPVLIVMVLAMMVLPLPAFALDLFTAAVDGYAAGAKGWITPFEPYREVHSQNLKLVHDYWKDRTLPKIAP